MKHNKQLTLVATLLALGASAMLAVAQDNNNDAPPAGGPDQRGPGMGGHRPPPPAIIRALDANHDGVIDADEIANASAALKTLDKNGDGKLTMREAMGPRPPMRGGRPDGPRMRTRGDDNNTPASPAPDDDGGNNPPPGPPPADN